jgi:hypothetical protein
MVSSTYTAIARRREEQNMTDSCVIVATTQSGDPDPATGKPAETTQSIYSGACEFVTANTQARTVASGGRALVQTGATLKLPVDAPGSAAVAAGHVATITLESHDKGSAPVVVRVTDGHRQTLAVARRIPVEVISNG